MPSHYHILGIEKTASADEIKKAYRKLAKEYHPDKNSGNKQAKEKFLQIALAYEVLSHAEQRKAYDASLGATLYASKNIHHYFQAVAGKTDVKLCEEFELTYTYIGLGRYLQKPALSGFFITGRPFVYFNDVKIDGQTVKETNIVYILSATHTGIHGIDEATIKIENRQYHSKPIYIKVTGSDCFFSRKKIAANGKPLRYKMFYIAESGSQTVRYRQNHTHTVLIPRSHKAKVIHDIGSALKIGFAIWGMFVCISIEVFPLLGIIIGSAYGWLNASVLYIITGIRSKFYFSQRYFVVRDYLQKGFLPGDESSSNFKIARVISWIIRLLA